MGESSKSMSGKGETRHGKEIKETSECEKYKERAKQNTPKAQ